MPRRVGSARAANTLSSCSSEYLTIRFSINQPWGACQARFYILVGYSSGNPK
jgi:hypothetical protein